MPERVIADTYDVIYLLCPIKEVEPGWWKLKWKPIWRQTYSVYRDGWGPRPGRISFRYRNWDARNGWGRSYKTHRIVFIDLYSISISTAWVRMDFVVMAEGPSDMSPRRPLDVFPRK